MPPAIEAIGSRSMSLSSTVYLPQPGMFVTVRNRRGVISGVDPFDGDKGRLHLVQVEYKDDHSPISESLLWELEPRKHLLEPTALPDPSGTDPMPPEDLDALLRATRWSATLPYLDPDGAGPLDRLPISSPFHGAVQIEDYQLVPLLKALRMPRVNLLLADDVGLGKTIEAGLILTELLLRRRIQRILILTPASLRLQWRDEMWEKFSIPFNLVDRRETHELRKKLGMDANPWRSFTRIIASYHYLRQEDVLEQFLAACRAPEGSPHLPWDLLVLDECHNLMPSAFGDESDLCRMLRLLAPQFEHRLFLSATPHNGHTRCFTGLLEILDPVRFSQTDEMKPAERERLQQVVLRRLKREINARTNPPKFCTRRPPRALILKLSEAEHALDKVFDIFRKKVKGLIAGGERKRRRAGSFAVEILGKRLLSCPTAFAESWQRCKEGLALGQDATDTDVATAEKNLKQETGDDREVQSREANAASVVGGWLKAVAGELDQEINAIDAALGDLGFDLQKHGIIEQDPAHDARLQALLALIEDLLRSNGSWRDDERLVVFTEYKTTLDYIARRLREHYDEERILTLFGGMDEAERELVKTTFNDPAHNVRILLGTDAAAEGLNLQRTARYLLHYDCPWNPSKLEQRNGRLDRHGQARDVTVHHFVSDQDQDLRFLAYVLRKADEIREDLGSSNELFDQAAHRRLIEGESVESVQASLEEQLKRSKDRARIDGDTTVTTGAEGEEVAKALEAIAAEIDLDALAMRDTLEAAMAIRAGRPQLYCSEEEKVCRIADPGLPGWSEVIDDSLRVHVGKGTRGPVARLAFSPEPFLHDVGGREIFLPKTDTALMHLSHPMMKKAVGSLTRRRFPGTGESVSRWTVRRKGVPQGMDALLLLSFEELAVNDLRESFHHWVRTLAFPVREGKLSDPVPHLPAKELRDAEATQAPEDVEMAREVFLDVEPDLKRFLRANVDGLTADLRRALENEGVEARRREDERYRSRQGEVSSLIADNTLAKLEREIEHLKLEKQQGFLFGEAERLERIDRSIEEKKEEIERRTRHYKEVRAQLDRERERILRYLLPRRHAMSGEAQIFPVCFEVRLPGGAS